MGELTNLLLSVQKYFVVLLFTVMAFMWYNVKANEKINYSMNSFLTSLVFATSFPFILDVVSFIPKSMSLILRASLFFGFGVLLFISSFTSYTDKRTERVGVLKDIMDKKKDVPLKLEFVREIINPELKKLKQEGKSLGKEKLRIEALRKEAEEEEEKSEKRKEELNLESVYIKNEFKKLNKDRAELEREQDKLDEQKDLIETDRANIEKLKSKADKELNSMKEKRRELLSYEDNLNNERARIDFDKSQVQKQRKDLEKYKQAVDLENENILLKEREILELKKKIKSRDNELLNLKKRLVTLQTVIKKHNLEEAK